MQVAGKNLSRFREGGLPYVISDLILEIELDHYIFSLSLNITQTLVSRKREIGVQIRKRMFKHLFHAGLTTGHESV